ncbi:hypothetical protein GCM10010358_80780 [Streptomyces minutiscleroticus]|uniref:Transposase n=1 Tax=Streptomyces minutiscleroticus TaxID=68238 RepID=A0A918U9P7_9ACTN|nr:hypothetical protein GCM10010358_80780 [Streptomyces minutiscleroticus]
MDAYSAAAAVLSGRAKGTPKSHNGIAESIRVLRTARISAVKARTQAINQIRALIIIAPSEVRERGRGLTTGKERGRGLTTSKLIEALARARPAGDPADPAHAARPTLRRLARRYLALNEEIKETEAEIEPLVAQAAPRLVAHSPGSARRPPASSSSAQATIPSGCEPKPPSPGCAASLPPPRPRDGPTATGSIAAATGRRTRPCTPSSWSA